MALSSCKKVCVCVHVCVSFPLIQLQFILQVHNVSDFRWQESTILLRVLGLKIRSKSVIQNMQCEAQVLFLSTRVTIFFLVSTVASVTLKLHVSNFLFV